MSTVIDTSIHNVACTLCLAGVYDVKCLLYESVSSTMYTVRMLKVEEIMEFLYCNGILYINIVQMFTKKLYYIFFICCSVL